MYKVHCPAGNRTKFHPTVFLNAVSALGAGDRVQLIPDRPAPGDKGWSLLMRLPSVYHLQSDTVGKHGTVGQGVLDQLAPLLPLVREAGAPVVLDMGVECFFGRDELFAQLQAFVVSNGLAPGQLVVSSGNQIAGERYADFCSRGDVPPLVRFVPTYGGAWTFVQSYPDGAAPGGAVATDATPAAVPTRRPKRFVSLNGRGRPHRLFLGLYLFHKGLLDGANVSLLGYNSHLQTGQAEESRQLAMLEKILVRSDLEDTLRPKLPAFLQRLPLELDVKAADLSQAGFYASRLERGLPDAAFFDEADFNLVTETLFFADDAHLVTEKAFKAFAFQNPFVFIAQPHTLKLLRAMGFQTFEGLIDETYDTLTDDWQRLRASLQQIDHLAALSADEAEAMLASAAEIFKHNQAFLRQGLRSYLARDLVTRILPQCLQPG